MWGAKNAGVVHSHLCLHGQLGVWPHMKCGESECCSCLSDPFINLSVQGEVIGDCWSKVHYTWTGDQNQARGYWWLWLVATVYLAPLRLSSSGWWSAQSPWEKRFISNPNFCWVWVALSANSRSLMRQEGHESLSAPTVALKSPRRTSCSKLGMVKIVDARFS